MTKIAVVLSGCGVYDGAEIHESVLTLLALEEAGFSYQCFAPNRTQYHVINHLTGDTQSEQRNILVEAARIARGSILELNALDASYDALILPGGFGTAKNFTTWAVDGPSGIIQDDIKAIILHFIQAQKPIVALCMSPTTIAKALEGTSYSPILSTGTSAAPSPYDIQSIHNGMESIGTQTVPTTIQEVSVDSELKIISCPCYMMEGTIVDVKKGIDQAITTLKGFLVR
ncbi:MAG: isoprenoid biosynthesis glyoxalase ElbB [Cytophagaceae bacterium]|jgi:enhancing lycopene biosynthesis protein 2|nr:isoprenoid biosynthesis glyoxalase ElbB [Cytophagaceae bacterium]